MKKTLLFLAFMALFANAKAQTGIDCDNIAPNLDVNINLYAYDVSSCALVGIASFTSMHGVHTFSPSITWDPTYGDPSTTCSCTWNFYQADVMPVMTTPVAPPSACTGSVDFLHLVSSSYCGTPGTNSGCFILSGYPAFYSTTSGRSDILNTATNIHILIAQ